VVATVKGEEGQDRKLASALAALRTLSQKEDISIAIVGGLGAIHHGYESLTRDIDVVISTPLLNTVTRVAPRYGIKVIWKDPEGWHKLSCEGVNIDVVPEGGQPRRDSPRTIPGPKQLGVPQGVDYARLAGWMETKLSSYRAQDRADVVQVMKVTSASALARTRAHIGKVHAIYLERFNQLHAEAIEEKEQERKRGGKA
jgi:hypothetical protein